MPKPRKRTVRENRWASVDKNGELHLADRGVRKGDWAYEMSKWDVQVPHEAPHHVIRVTIIYEAPNE